jgi:hypothetical protein
VGWGGGEGGEHNLPDPCRQIEQMEKVIGEGEWGAMGKEGGGGTACELLEDKLNNRSSSLFVRTRLFIASLADRKPSRPCVSRVQRRRAMRCSLK